MKRKSILIGLIFFIFLQATLKASAAQPPIRLAVLPVIIAPQVNVGNNALTQMEVNLSRALLIPQNGFFKEVEYIPSTQSCPAFQEIWSELYKTNSNIKPAKVMKSLANKIYADFIVCAVLYRCSQNTIEGLGSGYNILSQAGVNLIIFDNRTGELNSKTLPQTYRGEYSQYGTADYLAVDCLKKLIDEMKPRQKLIGMDF